MNEDVRKIEERWADAISDDEAAFLSNDDWQRLLDHAPDDVEALLTSLQECQEEREREGNNRIAAEGLAELEAAEAENERLKEALEHILGHGEEERRRRATVEHLLNDARVALHLQETKGNREDDFWGPVDAAGEPL